MKNRPCIPGAVFWSTMLTLATFFYVAHCLRETTREWSEVGHGLSTTHDPNSGLALAVPILLGLATVASAIKMLYEHYRRQLMRSALMVELMTRLPSMLSVCSTTRAGNNTMVCLP